LPRKRVLAVTAAIGSALVVAVVGGVLIQSSKLQAQGQGNQGQGNDDESKIQQGFAIAPVELNVTGKDRALVGLGSYYVNAVGDCNGCHSMGPATELLAGGNPYFLP